MKNRELKIGKIGRGGATSHLNREAKPVKKSLIKPKPTNMVKLCNSFTFYRFLPH